MNLGNKGLQMFLLGLFVGWCLWDNGIATIQGFIGGAGHGGGYQRGAF